MNILFLYSGRCGQNLYRTVLIPVGMFGVANYLAEYSSHTVTIVHLELENTTVEEVLSRYKPDLVCLSLYYHYQSATVIELARQIKQIDSSLKILTGGLTATIFADEILNTHSEIDFIIRGDAEIPTLRLVKSLHDPSALLHVPNLSFRAYDHVQHNPMAFVVDNNIYNTVHYQPNLLVNKSKYSRLRMLSKSFASESQTYYSIGRGCSKQCTFCGGSTYTSRVHFQRMKPILKPIDGVITDLQKLNQAGYTSWSTCYNPPESYPYYQSLFAKISHNQINFQLIFDCFGLPNSNFIKDVANTFRPLSVLNLSPYSGSQIIRQLNGIGKYRNDRLLSVVHNIFKSGLGCSAYFTVGLAYETKNHILQTERLIKKLKSHFSKIRIYVQPIDFEPGTILSEQLKSELIDYPSSFKDYFLAYKTNQPLVYQTKHLSYDQIQTYTTHLAAIAR